MAAVNQGKNGTPTLPPSAPLPVGASIRHESAHLQVAGEARYVDDVPEPIGTLHAAFGTSAHAHARILGMDLAAVRAGQAAAPIGKPRPRADWKLPGELPAPPAAASAGGSAP